MFSRYPGKGKSTPSVRTVATSVPRSPVGPPPARGGGSLVFGAGFARGGVGARVGGGDGGSGAGAGFGGVTMPAARGPGGAATMFTRYIGGRGGGAGGRSSTSAATSPACSRKETPRGPRSRVPRPRAPLPG